MVGDLCPVWVSRRWWPWPKRYLCKGMRWGVGTDYPPDVLMLVLGDERKVFLHTAGRTITYGRRAFEWAVEKMNAETGHSLPIKRAT